jgi:lysozyme
MTIRFLDAATYFKGEAHQVEAWEYLQKNVSQTVLETFTEKYRKATTTVSSISNSTIATLPVSGINLIKGFEGFSSKAYYDPKSGGLPITIAYGSTRKLDGSSFHIGDTIIKEDGEKLLIYQLQKDYIPSLSKIPYWNEMNDKMRGALLSFGYNLGANFFNSSGFNTISVVLSQKRWNEVPKTLELYRNPGSSVESGLLRRRIAEGKLWSEGLMEMGYK